MGRKKYIQLNLKNIIFVLTALILGLIIGIKIESAYEKSTFKAYSWKDPPTIVNCYGPDLHKKTIDLSVNYWILKGEAISGVVYRCDSRYIKRGSIVIYKNRSLIGSRTIGFATKKKYFGSIYYSEIFLRPGSQNYDMLLIHELGHSFGYGHKKIPGSIMHPEYDMMGLDLN